MWADWNIAPSFQTCAAKQCELKCSEKVTKSSWQPLSCLHSARPLPFLSFASLHKDRLQRGPERSMLLKERGVMTGYDRTSGSGRQLLIVSPHVLRTSCGSHAASKTTYNAATVTKNVAGFRSLCACTIQMSERERAGVCCVLVQVSCPTDQVRAPAS